MRTGRAERVLFDIPPMFTSWDKAFDSPPSTPVETPGLVDGIKERPAEAWSGYGAAGYTARARPNAHIQPPCTWDNTLDPGVLIRMQPKAKDRVVSVEIHSPLAFDPSGVANPSYMTFSPLPSLAFDARPSGRHPQFIVVGRSMVMFQLELMTLYAAAISDLRLPIHRGSRSVAEVANACESVFAVDP